MPVTSTLRPVYQETACIGPTVTMRLSGLASSRTFIARSRGDSLLAILPMIMCGTRISSRKEARQSTITIRIGSFPAENSSTAPCSRNSAPIASPAALETTGAYVTNCFSGAAREGISAVMAAAT